MRSRDLQRQRQARCGTAGSCAVQFVCFICFMLHDMQDQQIPHLPHKRRTSIETPQCSATMIVEAEVSMTRQLDFNDVHSDVESIAPIIPGRECTTPQKSFSIPFCGSSYTPDCDDTLKPNIGMTHRC